MTPLTIVLWKWQRRNFGQRRVHYTADHVNRVVSMLDRHLSLPCRIICLTDDPDGINCETRPIPAPELLKYGGCWHRLWLFSDKARSLGERVVSVDLDTVIVSSLDPLLDRSDDFVIWRNLMPRACGPYCGSLWMLRTGSRTDVWERFTAEGLRCFKLERGCYKHLDCLALGYRMGTDQCWMGIALPDAATWTAADGVLSYRLQAKGDLPEGARIINFHGTEDPSLPACQAESPWISEHWH